MFVVRNNFKVSNKKGHRDVVCGGTITLNHSPTCNEGGYVAVYATTPYVH